ncbi:MAG TPA: glycosyltransferase [Solirubrobacteraceae bacterium]|nr:glycosyltransferase [Solirubrobacteraceae bacterium]
MWLVRSQLGEDAELLERDSSRASKARAAAGLVRGGLGPDEVARAVRRTGARIVHAHNLHPTLGWRALAAAREAGARVVLHLHQYRMVCAIGVCFRDGHECLRCHGRNTLPGIALNCRGSRAEGAAYGVALMAWQRRLAAQADACVVPSRFAEARLRAMGAPLGPTFVLPHVIREFALAPPSQRGDHALVVSRLAPEKGVEVAIEACRLAGLPLVVAGDGPERERLAARADGAVRFVGRVSPQKLAQLRNGARVALVPSLSAETFGLAAAEAMAAGLPVAASRVGALPELVPEPWLAPPGDAQALADVTQRLSRDGGDDGDIALARVREVTAPERVGPALAAVYERAMSHG